MTNKKFTSNLFLLQTLLQVAKNLFSQLGESLSCVHDQQKYDFRLDNYSTCVGEVDRPTGNESIMPKHQIPLRTRPMSPRSYHRKCSVSLENSPSQSCMSLRSQTDEKHLQSVSQAEVHASSGNQSGSSDTNVPSVVSQTKRVTDDFKDLTIEPAKNKSSNEVVTDIQDTTSPIQLEFRYNVEDAEMKAILQGQKQLSNQVLVVDREDLPQKVGLEKRYICLWI